MTTLDRERRRTFGKLWGFAIGLCVVLFGWPALAAPGALPGPPSSNGGERAFLRVEVPKRAAYVGESLPVTIRAYYRGDTSVTVTGAPALANTDFTLTEPAPAQGRVDIGGAPYLVVTWKGRLSPVKAGHYALVMTLPSTLKWQSAVERPLDPSGGQGDAPSRDPFGGFFDDLPMGSGQDMMQQMQRRMQQMMTQAASGFDLGAVEQKDVVLRASAVLDVAPLPAQGRPATFSGAVGHFELVAAANPTRLRAGEPTTLELRVRGQGSFDRLDTPGVSGSSDWKTYAPSVKQADDETKVFTQALVPERAGLTTIPPVAISYFDPDTAHYVTLETKPIAVDVSPGASMVSSSNGVVPAVAPGPMLAPDADLAGQPVRTLAPVFERRGFWMAQAVPFFGLGAALAGALYRRRLAGDIDRPRRLSAARALRGYSTAMDRAVDHGDAAAFFAAARGALQQRLGSRSRVRPEAITLSEIEGQLDAADARTIRQVFDSDAARFAGLKPEPTDLARWRQVVREQLHRLEES
jgi:hypothetical protein